MRKFIEANILAADRPVTPLHTDTTRVALHTAPIPKREEFEHYMDGLKDQVKRAGIMTTNTGRFSVGRPSLEEIERSATVKKVGPGISAQSPGQPLRREGVHRYVKGEDILQFTVDYAGWTLFSEESYKRVFGDFPVESAYGSPGAWFGIQRLHTMLLDRGWKVSEIVEPEEINQADFSSASAKRNEAIVERLEALVKQARAKALCRGYTERMMPGFMLSLGAVEDVFREDS